jgi:hypothetical protein
MTAKVIDNGINRRSRVAHLPAGRYAVGDPCYHVPDDLWMEYLEAGTEGDTLYDVDGKTIQLSDGRLVAAHGTAFGDGVYKGTDGFEYGVDAGLLGVVQLLDGETVDPRLGTEVTFPAAFTVSYDEAADGTVEIGHLFIPTDADYETEEIEYCSRCGVGEAQMSGLCEDCESEDEDED